MRNKRSWLYLFFCPLLIPLSSLIWKALSPAKTIKGSAGVVPSIAAGETKSLMILSQTFNQDKFDNFRADWLVQVDAKGTSPARGGLEYNANTYVLETFNIIRDKFDDRVGHDKRWTYSAVSPEIIHKVVAEQGSHSDLVSNGATLDKVWSAFPR